MLSLFSLLPVTWEVSCTSVAHSQPSHEAWREHGRNKPHPQATTLSTALPQKWLTWICPIYAALHISKEMFANNYCFQPVVFLVQREVLWVMDCRTGITLYLKREYKYWDFFGLFFFLGLKCRCYLFKRGEWQAISLVNFPTLCKPSCCLILPGDLLHNHHSQKRSQGHANLVICLWWNFNQHTMKVSLVRSHWPDFL